MPSADAVLEPVSVALKFGFLLVLYLFLLWVARGASRDLKRMASFGGNPIAPSAPAPDATGVHAASEGLGPRHDGRHLLRVERGGGLKAGSAYEIDDEIVLGRGNAADIPLEDTFASSRHARLLPQGSLVVLEDLGSTNGTYLNGEPLRGPQPLHPGDRIRIGESEFSYEH
jgi:hypothetical protein